MAKDAKGKSKYNRRSKRHDKKKYKRNESSSSESSSSESESDDVMNSKNYHKFLNSMFPSSYMKNKISLDDEVLSPRRKSKRSNVKSDKKSKKNE